MKELITKENWSFSGRKTKNLQVFITFGASPENINECLYFVTLMDPEFQELFQQEFNNLEDAISFMNHKYEKWEFVDRSTSSEGQSTCSAH